MEGKKIPLIKLSKNKENQKFKKRRTSSLDEMGELLWCLYFVEFSKNIFDCSVNSLAEIKEQRIMLELKYERLLLIQNNQQSARSREETKGTFIAKKRGILKV